MKKTTSIHLGSTLFNFDDDAYQLLKEYLDDIRANLDEGIDKEEVISDIELSISEKINEKNTGKTKIVTKSDIEKIIEIMGPASEFGSDEPKKESNLNKERRLYRDSDDILIAGVCSGIAAYFGIDPTVVRLLFVLLLFFHGIAFPIYIILWIVIPKAVTTLQKTEMRGTSFASKITGKTEVGEEPMWKKIISFPFVALRAIFDVLKKIFRVLIPVVRILVGIFIAGFSLLGISLISVGGTLTLLNRNIPLVFNNVPMAGVLATIPVIAITLSTCLVLLIPLVFSTILGVSLIRKKNLFSFAFVASAIGIWILSGVLSLSLILTAAPKIMNELNNAPIVQQKTESIAIGEFEKVAVSGSDVRVHISKGDAFSIIERGRLIDIASTTITNTDGVLSINHTEADNQTQYCINCYTRPITFDITMPYLDSVEASGETSVSLDAIEQRSVSVIATNNADITINENAKFSKINLTLDNRAICDASGSIDSLIATMKHDTRLNLMSATVGKINITANGNTYINTKAEKVTGSLSGNAFIRAQSCEYKDLTLEDNAQCEEFEKEE